MFGEKNCIGVVVACAGMIWKLIIRVNVGNEIWEN